MPAAPWRSPGVWVGGAAAVAGGLALGTGERGSELAAVLQQFEGPHHQLVTAPIRRVPAGQWPAGRCEIGSGGALLDDGHVPQGPLQGGLDAQPRRGDHLVCGSGGGGGCRRPGPGAG